MPVRIRKLIVATSVSLAGAAGCAQPVTVRISPMGSVPATIKLDLLAGAEAADPRECATPCDVTLQPGTRHALEMRADGFYPARVDLDHLQAARTASALGKNPVPLVLPLVKLAEPADVSASEATLERLPDPERVPPTSTDD